MDDEEAEFAAWIAEREVCPSCGGAGVHIVWGLVAKDMADLEDQGTLVLGGCLVDDGDPDWECLSCQHRWVGVIDYSKMDIEEVIELAISGDEAANDYLDRRWEINPSLD